MEWNKSGISVDLLFHELIPSGIHPPILWNPCTVPWIPYGLYGIPGRVKYYADSGVVTDK